MGTIGDQLFCDKVIRKTLDYEDKTMLTGGILRKDEKDENGNADHQTNSFYE